MKRALLVALVLTTFARTAIAQLPAWSEDAQRAWWVANPTLEQESQAALTLQQQLAADYTKNGASAFAQSDFQNWLDLDAWIKVGVESAGLLKDPANFTAYVAIGNDSRVMHEFVEKMTPEDKGPAALAILIRLARASLPDLHRYSSLGIAYSLVFDEPFPKDWPHDQVAHDAVPIGDLDPVKRFQFYVACNDAHKLDLDLTQLSFENLKFLVDSEVSLSELTWAQQNTTTVTFSHFADAFFSINYTMMRLSASGGYNWNLPTYRLIDIKQVGGICVDQAYYAYLVGKGRGIPTLFLCGQGDEGGHAWFGYLDRTGAWQLDCGRYEEQNYAKGYTQDPQNWRELKDTDLTQAIKNGVDDANYRAAHAALAWAWLQGDTNQTKNVYEDARTIMPTLAAAWHAEADYLDRTNASIDDQKAFYQDWATQMAAFPDQKVVAQRRLVAELRKANDSSADSVEQDIILQNRTGGVDLAVDGTSEAIDDHFTARDWDGARMEFERSVRDFGEKGGGTYYFRIIVPYITKCWGHGLVEQAKTGLEFVEDRTKFDQSDWRNTNPIASSFDTLQDWQKNIQTVLAGELTWLGEIDNGQLAQAWNESAAELQKTAADDWGNQINAVRKKAGNVTSRTCDSIGYYDHVALTGSQVPGPFVIAQFTTTCESGTLHETVWFKKTGRDAWQAYDYDVEPGAPVAATPASAGN